MPTIIPPMRFLIRPVIGGRGTLTHSRFNAFGVRRGRFNVLHLGYVWGNAALFLVSPWRNCGRGSLGGSGIC